LGAKEKLELALNFVFAFIYSGATTPVIDDV